MRVNLGDLRLNVEVGGRGEPPVLMHGFTGCARGWSGILPALNARRRTIAVDLIGHGESDAPADPARYARERCEEDRKFRALARHMAGRIPDVRTVAIDGAGHAAHLEKPAEFTQAVLRFLTEEQGRPPDRSPFSSRQERAPTEDGDPSPGMATHRRKS